MRLCLWLLCLLGSMNLEAATTCEQTTAQAVVMEHARELPSLGKLVEQKGTTYLEIDSSWVKELAPLIDCPGRIQIPPTPARFEVFSKKEKAQPLEIGESYVFSPKAIASCIVKHGRRLHKDWVVELESPALQELRKSYGLRKIPLRSVIGQQLPIRPNGWLQDRTLSVFNTATDPVEPLHDLGDFETVSNPKLLSTVAKIEGLAQLWMKDSGYMYLDLNNSYIESALELLPESEDFSRGPGSLGAHISVVYEAEIVEQEVWEPQAIGEWFEFEVKALRYVDRKHGKKHERIWFLAVDSPALQRLRKHWGMGPKLQGHDFHITLGYEDLNRKALPKVAA